MPERTTHKSPLVNCSSPTLLPGPSMTIELWSNKICFRSDLPCAVQVDLTWVKFNVLFLIKDAVDDGLQHLMQIQHANSLIAKQYHMLKTSVKVTVIRFAFLDLFPCVFCVSLPVCFLSLSVCFPCPSFRLWLFCFEGYFLMWCCSLVCV